MIDIDAAECPADEAVNPNIQKRQYNTIILAGVGIVLLFYPVVAYLVLFKGIDPVWRVFLSRVIIWATLPVIYQYARKVEGRPFFLWEEKKYSFWFYPAALIGLFVLLFFAMMISSIPHYLGFHDNDTVLKYWNTLLKQNKALLVFVCVTAGITEELLFRAYIVPRFSLIFKPAYAPVLRSAALFSLMHIGYWNLRESIFTFLFGVISAAFYQKYRNIKPLIIFHTLYDLLILV